MRDQLAGEVGDPPARGSDRRAPAWSVFALAGAALAAYGIATVLAVYWVPWGKR